MFYSKFEEYHNDNENIVMPPSKGLFTKRNIKQSTVIASNDRWSTVLPIESETTVLFCSTLLQMSITFIQKLKIQA